MPTNCVDDTCSCGDSSQFLISKYLETLDSGSFVVTTDEKSSLTALLSQPLAANVTPELPVTGVLSSPSAEKPKVVTRYQLPHSLVVICCYLSTTALALYCLHPVVNTAFFLLLLSLSIGSYLYHAFYLSGLEAGMADLNVFLSRKKWRPFVTLALKFTCFIEYASKLSVLLMHIGFESALSLHGAYSHSRNLFVTGIMAISHGLIELLAEYGSLFHAKSILELPKKVWRIRIEPLFINYSSFFSMFAFFGFFGFAYGALAHLVSASIPTIALISTMLFSIMAGVYARVYVANIQTFVKDQVDHGVAFSYKHAMVACLSLISAVALYFEYYAHGMVLMSDVAVLLNSCVCSIFGVSGSTYINLLVGSVISPALVQAVTVGFVFFSSASAALLWSWVMYGAATRQEGCANCTEDVRLPSYYLHITALVGGLVAAIELHDFLDGFVVSQLPLVPMMLLSAVSAYLVEYAFFAGDDSKEQASLTLDIAKSMSTSSASLVRNTQSKKTAMASYVPELICAMMFKK